MLADTIAKYRLILGSASPRRKQLLEEMGLIFQQILRPIEETYPSHLQHAEITDYIVKLKAQPFINALEINDILITSDTIVWHQNSALGKPSSKEEAKAMLKSLSNKHHDVITSICLTSELRQTISNSVTKVYFKELSNDEIDYYINSFNPLDKAGAYGIQEWIGQIGVAKIEGSYENVVGLPTQLLYDELSNFIKGD